MQFNATVPPGDTVVLSAVRLVITGSVLKTLQLIIKAAKMIRVDFIFTGLKYMCML